MSGNQVEAFFELLHSGLLELLELRFFSLQRLLNKAQISEFRFMFLFLLTVLCDDFDVRIGFIKRCSERLKTLLDLRL